VVVVQEEVVVVVVVVVEEEEEEEEEEEVVVVVVEVALERCGLLEKGIRDDPVSNDDGQAREDAFSVVGSFLALEMPEVEN
jgi:hypothetical protein